MSYAKVIAEHEQWINNPAIKLKAKTPDDERRRCVEEKWPSDIARNAAYKEIIDGILRERGNDRAD